MNPWQRFWLTPQHGDAAHQTHSATTQGPAHWWSPQAISERQHWWWQQATDATTTWLHYWTLALPAPQAPVGKVVPPAAGTSGVVTETAPDSAVAQAAAVVDAFDAPAPSKAAKGNGHAIDTLSDSAPPAPRKAAPARRAPARSKPASAARKTAARSR